MTKHCHNWKLPNLITIDGVKTVCSLRRPIEALAETFAAISCGTCSLRVLREGQDLGLDIDKCMSWSWTDLGAMSPPKKQVGG